MQEHFIRQLHRAIDSLYLNMVGWTLYFKLVTLVTSCQVHHRVCVCHVLFIFVFDFPMSKNLVLGP